MSYAEAAKQVKRQDFGQRMHPWGPMGGASEILNQSLVIENKKLVTFIASVINNTAGVESKRQKIQLIVEAAVHHLGLVGMTWEEVRDELR